MGLSSQVLDRPQPQMAAASPTIAPELGDENRRPGLILTRSVSFLLLLVCTRILPIRMLLMSSCRRARAKRPTPWWRTGDGARRTCAALHLPLHNILPRALVTSLAIDAVPVARFAVLELRAGCS